MGFFHVMNEFLLMSMFFCWLWIVYVVLVGFIYLFLSTIPSNVPQVFTPFSFPFPFSKNKWETDRQISGIILITNMNDIYLVVQSLEFKYTYLFVYICNI